MSSGAKRPKYSGPARSLYGSTDVSVNRTQIDQLRTIYETHPAIIAAVNVLESQLLGGGLQLRIEGEVVSVDPQLLQHIDECWMPFARDLISAFLIYGFAVISYDTEDVDCPTVRTRAKRRVEGILNGKVLGRKREQEDDNDSSKSRGSTSDSTGNAGSSSAQRAGNTWSGGNGGNGGRERSGGRGRRSDGSKTNNIVPMVVSPNKYTLKFYTPANSYRRRYVISKTASAGSVEEDTDSSLIVQNAPDEMGNINSPMASVHSIIEFINTLIDSALNAEVSRSNPMMVTEQHQKDGRDGISVSDSYFDVESQNIARTQTMQENEMQARLLKMQLDMCRSLNVNPMMLNRGAGASSSGSTVGSATESIRRNIEMSSRIFALPMNQRIASSVPQAQSRSDLQALMRLSIEYICAALGVPSSLIFEGRFSSRSTAHLALLNSTVQRLAKLLDSTLTQAYIDIYGIDDASRKVELVTVVSPLASCEEILALFQGGLADYEIAAPLALNSVGADVNDINAAMERFKERQERQERTSQGQARPGAPESASSSSGNDDMDRPARTAGASRGSTQMMLEELLERVRAGDNV